MAGEERHDDGLVHDEVEIEDFEYDPEEDTFTYPCPCGDEFSVMRVSFDLFNRLTIHEFHIVLLLILISQLS